MVKQKYFRVIKEGKRVDSHVLSLDLLHGTIVYADKKGLVHYESNGWNGYECIYKEEND